MNENEVTQIIGIGFLVIYVFLQKGKREDF